MNEDVEEFNPDEVDVTQDVEIDSDNPEGDACSEESEESEDDIKDYSDDARDKSHTLRMSSAKYDAYDSTEHVVDISKKPYSTLDIDSISDKQALDDIDAFIINAIERMGLKLDSDGRRINPVSIANLYRLTVDAFPDNSKEAMYLILTYGKVIRPGTIFALLPKGYWQRFRDSFPVRYRAALDEVRDAATGTKTKVSRNNTFLDLFS